MTLSGLDARLDAVGGREWRAPTREVRSGSAAGLCSPLTGIPLRVGDLSGAGQEIADVLFARPLLGAIAATVAWDTVGRNPKARDTSTVSTAVRLGDSCQPLSRLP